MPRKTKTPQKEARAHLKRAQSCLAGAVESVEQGDRIDALDAIRLTELRLESAKRIIVDDLPEGMKAGPVRNVVTQDMIDRMRIAMIFELKRKNPDMDTTQNEEDRIETNEAMQRVLEAVLNG